MWMTLGLWQGPLVTQAAVDHIYVANENVPCAVRELDPITGAFVGCCNAPAWSSGAAGRYITRDPQGRLWVTDNGTRRIYAIDCSGAIVNSYLINAPHNFGDIEYSQANDKIYVVAKTGASGSAQQLVEVNPATGSQTVRISWDSSFEANYVGFSPDGYLYVTAWGQGGARVYDPSTFGLVRTVAPPADISQPRGSGVAFVGEFFYLVHNNGGGSGFIDEYRQSDGGRSGRVATLGYAVCGMERATDTSLWVVAPYGGVAGAIVEVDIGSGTVLRTLSQGGYSGAGNQDLEVAGSCTCRTIDIQRPVSGQAVQKECSLTIRWHTEGSSTPNWKFFLDKNGVFQQQLFPTPVDDGNGNWHAAWQVPNGLADGTDYSIVVKDDTCVVDDHSPEFAILETIILGDMNADGVVDGLDIPAFIQLLLNP